MTRFSSEVVRACHDLVRRCGGQDFEVKQIHDEAWDASVVHRGLTVRAVGAASAAQAAMSLATSVLVGVTCRCGRPVTLTGHDVESTCHWRLLEGRFEPTCPQPQTFFRRHKRVFEERRRKRW